jgi:Ca-activated chloride channel homolog
VERSKDRQTATRVSLAVAAVFLFLLPCAGQTSPPVSNVASQPRQHLLSVQSNLVVLPVSVTDRHGRFLAGLGENDFRVYEDGQPRKISFFESRDLPVTVGLVIDQSTSMMTALPAVEAAGLAFARSSNPQDQIFIVDFNEAVALGLPSDTPFAPSIGELEAALSASSARGMTALYDAIAAGLDHLELGNGDKKALIVISDGGDNASKLRLPQILDMARHSGALIYSIGLATDQDEYRKPVILKELAKATGAEAYSPESPQEAAGICRRIARELRAQYMIGYVPAPTANAGYRRLRVTADVPDGERAIVRTRAGYFPTPPATASR